MTQVSFHSTQDVLVDVKVMKDRHMTQVSFHSTQDMLVDVTVMKDRHVTQVSFHSTQDVLVDVSVINDRVPVLAEFTMVDYTHDSSKFPYYQLPLIFIALLCLDLINVVYLTSVIYIRSM